MLHYHYLNRTEVLLALSFEQEHRDSGKPWTWEGRDAEAWIRVPEVEESLIAKAHALEGRYANLKDSMAKVFPTCYSRYALCSELIASWWIEGEHLNITDLFEAVGNEDLQSVIDKRDEIVSRNSLNRAEAVVYATKRFLNVSEDERSITVKDVLSLHRYLGNDDNDKEEKYFHWGKLRQREVYVGNRQRVIYVAPNHELVPNMMEKLCKLYESNTFHALPALVGATLIHTLFVNVHPFMDGNGRTARLLANRYARTHGIDLLGFSAMIAKNLNSYYQALRPTNYRPEDFGAIIDMFLSSFDMFLNLKEQQIKDFSEVEQTICESSFTEDEKTILRAVAYNGKKRMDTIEYYFAGDYLPSERKKAALDQLMERRLLSNAKSKLNVAIDKIISER